MSDQPEYLQAATVETLLRGIEDGYLRILSDGTEEPPSGTGKFYVPSEIRIELTRRFKALEAERDELKSECNRMRRKLKQIADDEAMAERCRFGSCRD